MKRLFLTLAAAALCAPVWADPQVGVSVDFGQPGFYGRIDVGRVGAPPVLIYPQPMIISAPPVAVVPRPIDLHVPPGHARHWDRHCGRYGACAQPVYFVHDDWARQYVAGRHAPPYGVHYGVHYGGQHGGQHGADGHHGRNGHHSHYDRRAHRSHDRRGHDRDD